MLLFLFRKKEEESLVPLRDYGRFSILSRIQNISFIPIVRALYLLTQWFASIILAIKWRGFSICFFSFLFHEFIPFYIIFFIIVYIFEIQQSEWREINSETHAKIKFSLNYLSIFQKREKQKISIKNFMLIRK